MSKFSNFISKTSNLIPDIIERRKVEELIKMGHRPVYHIHIRKTAGSTINLAFLSETGLKDGEQIYNKLAKKRNHRVISENKVFVGWNTYLIKKGQYSYAFSHTPLHQLYLPQNAFLFTILRDPVKRVISHYNMLKYYKANKIDHPCMKREAKWLGNSFDEFINNMPKEHLLNQLYMFSENYNLDEAIHELLNLDQILFTEDIESGINSLSKRLNWDLPISNQKKYNHKEKISATEVDRLQGILHKEYKLIDRIKESL